MVKKRFGPGDYVVYRKLKHSTSPGPRAQEISPASSGDAYSYLVDKFWVVREELENGHLVLVTRRGKEHIVAHDDRNLRHCHWWERLFYSNRFPESAIGSH